MTMDMLYHFPRTRFVDENTIGQQLIHTRREGQEASDELPPPGGDIMPLALEIMDIYHSAETALRILEEKHGIDIQKLMFAVYEKNEKRGYYDAHN